MGRKNNLVSSKSTVAVLKARNGERTDVADRPCHPKQTYRIRIILNVLVKKIKIIHMVQNNFEIFFVEKNFLKPFNAAKIFRHQFFSRYNFIERDDKGVSEIFLCGVRS